MGMSSLGASLRSGMGMENNGRATAREDDLLLWATWAVAMIAYLGIVWAH
jgi:hypothetical protein